MSRCASRRAFGALALISAFSIPAAAQAQVQRNFPQHALRGEIVVVQPPEISLNGKGARLAPGARIWGENNLLVMSASIVGAKMTVNYTADSYGLVKDVWILRPEEVAKTWPKTPDQAARWAFDPVAQVWTKR